MSLLLFFGSGSGVAAATSLYPTVFVEFELAGAGNGWTNCSGDVFRNPGIEIVRGIRGGGPLDLVASIGTCRFAMNNSATNSGGRVGYFSPHHALRRPGWGLNIGCRVRAVDPYDGEVYTVFLGKIASLTPMPGVLGQRRVEVTAVDWMDEAARWNMTADIEPQVDKRGDELVQAIIDEMPFQPSAGQDFDATPDTYPYALDLSRIGSTPALSEFARIAQSGFDLLYVKADGVLRMESRHTRLLNTTVDWNLDDNTMAFDGGLEIEVNRDDIINTVRCSAHTRVVDESASAVVYNQVNVIPIGAGETKTLIGPYRDEATGEEIGAVDVQAPAPYTDYTANEAPEGVGTDRTNSLSVSFDTGASGARFRITNGHSDTVFLTRLQLRGKRVLDWGTDIREESDADSILRNGEHAVTIDMPYQGVGDVAAGACLFTLYKWGDVR